MRSKLTAGVLFASGATLPGCPGGEQGSSGSTADATDTSTGSGSSEESGGASTSTTTTTAGNDDTTTGASTGASTTSEITTDASSTTEATTEASTGASSTGETTTEASTGASSTGDASTGADTTEGGSSGAPGACGDGAVDPGEACDDGNSDEADACSTQCELNKALSVTMGYEYTCASISGETVKCWGRNDSGQLGLGDIAPRGDEPGEMGDALPFVQLGAPAVEVDSGFDSTCARLADGGLKCWGANFNGQLGLGDTEYRGYKAGQMGAQLPYVDLGAGKAVVAMSLGNKFACAVLDTGQVKCWGINWLGQLGLGDKIDRGTKPGEMGDGLPPVDLGQGVKVVDVAAGVSHTCALLEGGSVKCWGRGDGGQLGLGDKASRGDGPGEMGDTLPAVDLGPGAVVTSLVAAGGHTCALLTTHAVKCWGRNDDGQLGLGDTDHRGDAPGEMGQQLPAVDLGAGKTAVALGASIRSTCALFDDGTIKCWGWNLYGQLGLGDKDARGDQPGEMGDNLPIVDLGQGQSAVSLGSSNEATHQCAVLAEGPVKCWGNNNPGGQLGLGDTLLRGDNPGEMGDSLPTVKLLTPAW